MKEIRIDRMVDPGSILSSIRLFAYFFFFFPFFIVIVDQDDVFTQAPFGVANRCVPLSAVLRKGLMHHFQSR